MCLPTRAPECPFSGLSLTMATACPMLPLGFMSSPGSLMLPCAVATLRGPYLPLPPRTGCVCAYPQERSQSCLGLPLGI